MTRTLTNLTVGAQLPPRTIGPITLTDIIRFAGAGGDFNPLHHDADYARAAGLPGLISMGQMQAGMLGSWVTDLVGIENLRGYAVRFSSPLEIGETLMLAGTVASINPDTGIAELELSATVDGRDVVHGSARVQTSTS